MNIYIFNNFYIFDDLEENFIKILGLNKVSNINDANYLFFHNFCLDNRKFLLKNKDLLEKQVICYLHEPICQNTLEMKKMIKRLRNFPSIIILTYSISNLNSIKKLLKNTVKYFPINYYLESDIKFKKEYNISIYHRNYNHNYNNNNYNSKIISPKLINDNNLILFNHWCNDKIDFLSKLKIFINLHKNDKTSLLETLRIHELIKYRVIIISQKCICCNDPLSKYVIFVDDNKLISKSIDVLNNYDYYFNKIYGKLTNKEIFECLPTNL